MDFGAQQLVGDTVLAVENPAPDHRDGGGGANQRQEKDGAEAAFEFHLCVEQHSDQEGQGNAHRHGQDTKVNSVPGGLPEFSIPKHIHIVLQANELVAAKAEVFTEAGVQSLYKGPQVQDHKADDGGGHHEPAPIFFPPGGGRQFSVHQNPSSQSLANFLAVSVSAICCIFSSPVIRS